MSEKPGRKGSMERTGWYGIVFEVEVPTLEAREAARERILHAIFSMLHIVTEKDGRTRLLVREYERS